ncbi:MAG TPA: hypothetical protein P5560_05840 [Thermotogota bacterium]|nr:hypothetical protein [Thermotogota bacterium]HRW92460.1 hypothetical protein [Thermotogota bacterium]
MNVQRALISVFDKTGIVEFSRSLASMGVELLATEGSYEILVENGIPVRSVADFTGQQSILDGRVKTIHPKIAAGVLADRSSKEHMEQLEQFAFPPIDLLVINPQPFPEMARHSRDEKELLENLDIGGQNLLRAGAKNYRSVVVLVDPKDYPSVVQSLQECGDVTLQERRVFALKAFYSTMHYDAQVHSLLSLLFAQEKFSHITLERERELRYGENPHQDAYVARIVETDNLFCHVDVLQGEHQTFNAFRDLYNAIRLSGELEIPCNVLVRHKNPLIVQTGEGIERVEPLENLHRVLEIKGGTFLTTEPVTLERAKQLYRFPYDMIAAPSFDSDAMALFSRESHQTLVSFSPWALSDWEYHYLDGSFLVQERDKKQFIGHMKWAGTEPSDPFLAAWMEQAFLISKNISSDSIVLFKDNCTIGIGAGQMLREDAFALAQSMALRAGYSLDGAVLASDGEITNDELMIRILESGVRGIVAPGFRAPGPKISDLLQQKNVAFLQTNRRHFSG